MAKESLANKYRPKDFNDVVSQKAIIDILSNQINSNTFKHCYLFTGPAGCGKTTIARIIAKKINNQETPDIIEIDGASNNGVDNVRNIIEQAKQRSLLSKYKIFIIDEFHQVTSAGQNALLKIFEDCPQYTIFILATTDPQKILPTIISRVQQFKLSKISTNLIYERLKYICDKEKIEDNNIDYKENALQYIAKLADGGMRLAISSLDTCLSLNKNIDVDIVSKALGISNIKTNCNLLYALYNNDKEYCIELIEKVYNEGKDIKQFILDFYKFIIDVCKYHLFNKSFTNTKLPDTQEMINELAPYKLNILVKIQNNIAFIKSNMRYETNPLYLLESEVLNNEYGGASK